MTSKLAVRFMAFAICLAPATPRALGQRLDRFLNAVVGIEVPRGGDQKERGTGFVASVEGSTLLILTARHLFFEKKDSFKQGITVTLFVDKSHTYPATLAADSPALDVAVLKIEAVSQAVVRQIPAFPTRPESAPLSIEDALRVFSGQSLSWQVPSGIISNTANGDQTDEFQFTQAGVQPGFSGAPVLDSSGLLIGIHLGSLDDMGPGYGRAIRITKAIQVLHTVFGMEMNRLSVGAPPGTLPTTGGVIAANTGDRGTKDAPEKNRQTIDEIRERAMSNPALFGKIEVDARKAGKWDLVIYAFTRSFATSYYNVNLQAILQGVGNNAHSVTVSDLQPAGMPYKYHAMVDELGKSAVVCYTATPDPASPEPKRLTAWFSISVSGNVATFIPSRPPALGPASDAPCDPETSATQLKSVQGKQIVPEQPARASPPNPIGATDTSAVPAIAVPRINPADFAAVQIIASKQAKWSLYVTALSGVGMPHHGASLQVIVKGPGNSKITLPVSRDTLAGATTTKAVLEEMGQEVIVCYTATPNLQPPQMLRLTSAFAIDIVADTAHAYPSRQPTLGPASDAPCQ